MRLELDDGRLIESDSWSQVNLSQVTYVACEMQSELDDGSLSRRWSRRWSRDVS